MLSLVLESHHCVEKGDVPMSCEKMDQKLLSLQFRPRLISLNTLSIRCGETNSFKGSTVLL